MQITIFNDVTTEDILAVIEEDSATYTGLYVEMDNAPERKYVKDHASKITGIIKKLDRARIDKKKALGVSVESEYTSIVERLKTANEPFTLLLDEYKAKRDNELRIEKELVAAKALMIQVEGDHEIAILINRTHEADKAESLRVANEEAERIQKEANERAEQIQASKAAHAEQCKINAENARLADVEHVRAVNNETLKSLTAHGMDEVAAKKFIRLIANKSIPNITINY